jgi:hypothetical protein
MSKQMPPALGINKLNLAGIGRSDVQEVEETKEKIGKDVPKKAAFNLDLSKAKKEEHS